jgi:hypothetical protein
MVEMKNACNILIGKPARKRPFRRPRHRWEDNIRMDCKKWGGKLWTGCICLRIGTSGRSL